MKQETKDKLANLFDNDRTNSHNIFDRIQNQMMPDSIEKRAEEERKELEALMGGTKEEEQV